MAVNYFLSSSTGNDSNSGTSQGSAWQSIAKLNTMWGTINAGDTISFMCGDVFFGEIIIGKTGTTLAPITFNSWSTGAMPIISGFFNIPSWTSIGGNLWTAVVSSAQSTLNMMTINGSFQPIGRWPKVGTASSTVPAWTTGGYLQYSAIGGNEPPSPGLSSTITSSEIGSALSYVGGEIVIRANHFNINRGTITNQTSTVVTYTQQTGSAFTALDSTGNGFFFQNHPNACTQQGDWAYNSGTKTVTLFSTTDPTNTVNVSVNANTVSIPGKSFFIFDGLSFQGSNSAAFNITSVSGNIQINNCDISFHGTNGIFAVSSACHDISLNNTTVNWINNNGIDANNSSAWVIDNNCQFTNIGTMAGMGISGDSQYFGTAYLGVNSLVQYSTFDTLGYHGIMFRGDACTVQYNRVNNFCLIKDDGGGIYCYLTTSAGTKLIQNNIVTNGVGAPQGTASGVGGGGAIGIYLDGASTNAQVLNNGIANCQQLGILFNNPLNLTCNGNNVFNSGGGFQGGQMQINENNGQQSVRNVTHKLNIYVAHDSGQDCMLLYAPSGLDVNSFFTTTDFNIYARPVGQGTVVFKRESGPVHMTIPSWQTFSGKDASTTGTPLLISDPSLIKFYYNYSNASSTISLPGTFEDMNGNMYVGSVTLPAYTSITLIQTAVASILPSSRGFIIV